MTTMTKTAMKSASDPATWTGGAVEAPPAPVDGRAAPSVGRLRRVLLTKDELAEMCNVGDWDKRCAAFDGLGLEGIGLASGETEWDHARQCWIAIVTHDSFAEVPLGSEVPWHERPSR
jgi:hypothetical protein